MKVTDARGSSTLYEFDPLNRVTKVTDPLNRAKTFAYDANGNKVGETDAKGRTVQYAYDGLNRLTTVTAPEGKTVSYAYDKAGNRLQMTDATVKRTGKGTRNWTKTEKKELLRTGQVKGYEGHHINNVANNPELARDPGNVQFVKGRSEHLGEHSGNWRNPTSGDLIDR